METVFSILDDVSYFKLNIKLHHCWVTSLMPQETTHSPETNVNMLPDPQLAVSCAPGGRKTGAGAPQVCTMCLSSVCPWSTWHSSFWTRFTMLQWRFSSVSVTCLHFLRAGLHLVHHPRVPGVWTRQSKSHRRPEEGNRAQAEGQTSATDTESGLRHAAPNSGEGPWRGGEGRGLGPPGL